MARARSRLAFPIALAACLAPFVASCGPELHPANPQVEASGACDELQSGDFTKLDAPPKVNVFLDASVGLDRSQKEIEERLVSTCTDLGKAIGMADVDLKAPIGGGHGAETICTNVGAKISAVLKSNSGAELAISVDEPRCRIDVDAAKSCLETCTGQPLAPGDLAASCQGGEIAGRCGGQCKGTCATPAGACSGVCHGQCNGKCDAKFSGKCSARCEGACDGKLSKGACSGRCEGKCVGKSQGTCGGNCEGTCSATCDGKSGGSCRGACSGGCSTPLEGATCSGDLHPPGVDDVCAASCGAKAALRATCDEPVVRIAVKGKASPAVQKLVTALGVALPKVLAIQYGAGQRLLAAATALAATSNEAKDAALKRGQRAGGCAALAGNVTNATASSLRVEISASATVSAAASVIPKGG